MVVAIKFAKREMIQNIINCILEISKDIEYTFSKCNVFENVAFLSAHTLVLGVNIPPDSCI